VWNDTDIPLGYLITFRCYGTCLHGDERESTDRYYNIYKSPHIPASQLRKQHSTRRLKSGAVTLDTNQRQSVETAIKDTCKHRAWRLRALNVRTNHVHVVVSIGLTRPERALNALKANATRQMREDGNWQESLSPWADKGSQRYLWTERSLSLAIDYVINGQGGDLPDLG